MHTLGGEWRSHFCATTRDSTLASSNCTRKIRGELKMQGHGERGLPGLRCFTDVQVACTIVTRHRRIPSIDVCSSSSLILSFSVPLYASAQQPWPVQGLLRNSFPALCRDKCPLVSILAASPLSPFPVKSFYMLVFQPCTPAVLPMLFSPSAFLRLCFVLL